MTGNAKLLNRALSNVIQNAMRYSPADGKIEISLAREGGDAVIRISDNGPGVSEDELEKIFLPFFVRSVRVSNCKNSNNNIN